MLTPLSARLRNGLLKLSAPAALTLCMAALAGCSDEPDPASAASATAPAAEETSAPVHIATYFRAVDYAPFYVAQAESLFENASPDATFKYTAFDSPPAVLESLATGQVDFIFMAEPPALVAAAAGIDVRIAMNGVSLEQEILVTPDGDVKDVPGLDGKRIGVVAGTSSHYALFKILRDTGVDPSGVEIIDLSPPDAQAAFESGSIDAWAIWPPHVQQQQIQGSGETLASSEARINSLVIVRGAFVDEHPETYRQVLSAIEQAKTFIGEHPDQAKQLVAEAINIAPEVIDLAWPKHDFAATLSDEVLDDIQHKADFLLERDFIQTPVSVAELVVKK